MKKHARIAVLCAGALLAAPFAHAQASLADIDKNIRDAWSKLNSFSGVIKIDGNVAFSPPGTTPPPNAPKLPLTGAGTTEYLKDGDKAKYRQQIQAKLLGMVAAVDAVFDGAKLHLKTDLSGNQKIQQTEPSIDKGLVPPGGGPLLDEVQKFLALTPKPEAQVNGRTAYQLEGKLKDGLTLPLPVASVLISIDKETGGLTQLEFLGNDPTSKVTLAISEIQVNPALKAENFTPPTISAAPKATPAAAPAN